MQDWIRRILQLTTKMIPTTPSFCNDALGTEDAFCTPKSPWKQALSRSLRWADLGKIILCAIYLTDEEDIRHGGKLVIISNSISK